MRTSRSEPGKISLSSVLSAHASLGTLGLGKWVHEYIECRGIKWDVHIGTAKVDTYAKWRCLDMAVLTFHKRNASTWNAMLRGQAMHGHGEKALWHFDQIVRVGVPMR